MSLLTHFLTSNLKSEVEKKVRLNDPENKLNWGELISISFIATKEKKIQRNKFERYEGDVELNEKDLLKFNKIPGLNIQKEIDSCESIFCIINCKTNSIRITWNYSDKPDKVLNF